MRAVRIEIGMEVPTMRDAFQSPKKMKMMTIEMMTAAIMVWKTDESELLIISASSCTTMMSRFSSFAFSSFTSDITSFDMETAEESWVFVILSIIVSLPS